MVFHQPIWVLFFFPLWWKGNYSPLPQQLPQCFRDHSASFRDTHLTYSPSASFHLLSFWPFSFASYVRLSWAWTLWGHRQGVPLFGHVFLPRCFRKASARLPRNTEAKPNPHNVEYQNQFQYRTWKLSYIRILFYPLYFTNIPFRNLPRRTSFREASTAFRGLNPVRCLMNNYHRKLLHKNAKKERNSFEKYANVKMGSSSPNKGENQK